MAAWLTPPSENWMCPWAFVDGSPAPDAVSRIRATQRKPGAQSRSSHLPAMGPLGPDQRPLLTGWPLYCLQGRIRGGDFITAGPRRRSSETFSCKVKSLSTHLEAPVPFQYPWACITYFLFRSAAVPASPHRVSLRSAPHQDIRPARVLRN